MNKRASKKLIQAAKLFEAFTGHRAARVTLHPKPQIPDEAVFIGHCTGLMYVTRRDGKIEQYIHRFSERSRPIFAVTHDGKQLLLLGGNYDFTEKGIEDRG